MSIIIRTENARTMHAFLKAKELNSLAAEINALIGSMRTE